MFREIVPTLSIKKSLCEVKKKGAGIKPAPLQITDDWTLRSLNACACQKLSCSQARFIPLTVILTLGRWPVFERL